MAYSREDEEKDKKRVEELKAKLNEEEKKQRKTLDMLEKLIVLIFNKYMGLDTFIVLRPDEYDELVNNVTHIIIDKEKAETVCLCAEVGETRGQKFEERVREVVERNLRGGAQLKYGPKIAEGEEGERKVVPAALENIPVFYLALPEETIWETVRRFTPMNEKSDYEEGIFNFFLSLIELQIWLRSRAGSRLGLFFSQRVHAWRLAAGMRKVEKSLKQFSDDFKEDGFLLNEYCEAEMELFEGKLDSEGREKYTAEGIKADMEVAESHLRSIAIEQLREALVSREPKRFFIRLLNKFSKEGDYAIGSSHYDRTINEVDVLQFSKGKGNCIAAFLVRLGERGGPGPICEETKKRVEERNMKGGAYVKYAFKIVKENGKTKAVPCSQGNIPIFYMAIPEDECYGAIKRLALPEEQKGIDTVPRRAQESE